jgi:predicted ATPase
MVIVTMPHHQPRFFWCRSNELSTKPALSKLIHDFKQRASFGTTTNLIVTEILLGNLEAMHIRHMLMDLLASSKTSQLNALAEICYCKTNGNPFFIVQYLTLLQEVNLLTYNLGLCSWMWDSDKIQAETKATENVVDIVSSKMKKLPKFMLKFLQVAAFLGSSFHADTLIKVWASMDFESHVQTAGESASVDCLLEKATEEMFFEKRKDNSTVYQWVHDSILEAAVALLSAEDKKQLQFMIGSILIGQEDASKKRELVFVAANLLNAGRPESLDVQKKLELAQLNLLAAQNAVSVSAFESASRYISNGLSLLPNNCWSDNESICIELHSIGAEVDWCLGKIDQMDYYCNAVIEQDIPLLQKMRVYLVLLDRTAERVGIPQAIDLCLKVSKDLGCSFPKSTLAINISTIMQLLRFQSQAKSGCIDSISQTFPMTDKQQIWVMRLLDKLATYTYISEHILLPVSILRRLKYTLQCGICDSSAVDFIGLALILTSKLLDFRAGSAYANYSIRLLERINSRRSYSRVYLVAYGFVFPWTQPTQSILKGLLKGYEYGM